MKCGSLVVRKQVRIFGDYHLGVVVKQVSLNEDIWLVMWCSSKKFIIQEHVGYALLEVNDENAESIRNRRCILR